MADAPIINFKEASHEQLFELEAGSFWFRARNRLLLWALDTYAGAGEKRYLELGCGNGFVLSAIEKHFPAWTLFGSEALESGLERARTRVERATVLQLDARALPYTAEFDVVGAFDVLEHIAEDEQSLSEIHRSLKPGGLVVLTVPQHPFLWGPADEYAHHVRRYTMGELASKVTQAGFRVRKLTSFVAFLLPLMIASRMMQKLRPRAYDPQAEMKASPLLDKALEAVLGMEQALIRAGVRFPAGGSLLVVAEKA